jgi:phenylacetate-CoA ligase
MRYSRLYWDTLKFLNRVDGWSYEQARDYQLNELRKLLKHCQDNVPYYGKLFSDYGFDPNIKTFEEINKLPYLTKDIINANREQLIATNHNKLITFKTSGSTGNRLVFYGDDSMYKKEAAYIHHSIQAHHGALYDEWSIWIRRHSPKDEMDLIVRDYELKRIYMSPFHLNDNTIEFYVNQINKSNAKTLLTYPSTAYWLSCLLEKHNLKLPNIKAIHGASEKCLPSWDDQIKKVFGFSMKMHYGQVEKVAFMYQSMDSDYYHEDLTYSYTEFVDGIIVGTSFLNYTMPFVRYKTNDVVTLNDGVNNTESRPLTVQAIDGRVDDMIVAESGARIPSVNFYTVMSKREEVSMFQIHQYADKSIDMKIVVNDNFTNNIVDDLRNELVKRVGNLSINMYIVSDIERNPITGKIRCVITDIK